MSGKMKLLQKWSALFLALILFLGVYLPATARADLAAEPTGPVVSEVIEYSEEGLSPESEVDLPAEETPEPPEEESEIPEGASSTSGATEEPSPGTEELDPEGQPEALSEAPPQDKEETSGGSFGKTASEASPGQPPRDPLAEPAEESEPTNPETPEAYSPAALAALLEQLAEAQGQGEIQPDIDWLLETRLLADAARQTIYHGLLEDPERFTGLLEALRALRQKEDEILAAPALPTQSDNAEEILAAARQMEQNTREAGAAMAAESAAAKAAGDSPWIAWTDRQALPALDENDGERFRHYEVASRFAVVAAEQTASPVDVVLVLDNSISTQYVLAAQKAAALEFLRQPELTESGSRVALVTFSDEAQILTGLTDPGDPALAGAISGLATANMSNLQAGILAARQVFGMEDESPYDAESTGRRRAVVLLTDGAANYRYTDIWRYSVRFEGKDTQVYIDIDPQASSDPAAEQKRWSWADSTEVLPYTQKVYLDGEALSTSGVHIHNSRMARDTARLEAQYLVSLGVDVYSLNYGKDADYLEQLGRALETQPNFSSPIYAPPYEGNAASTARPGTRVFDPADPDAVQALCTELWRPQEAVVPQLTFSDQLGEGVELVENSLRTTDNEGNSPAAIGEASYADGLVTWVLPEGITPGEYAISYTVRVKDDPSQPLRYYPDGAEVSVSQAVSITCATPEGNVVAIEPMPVVVPPLLDITAGDVVVLAGEPVNLAGQVTRGNGRYTYTWYDGQESPLDSGEVPTQGVDPAAGLNLNIPVPKCAVTARAGESLYYLEVTDTLAWHGGYSGGRLRVPVKVTAVEASLTILVEGAGGTEIPGRFEVSLQKEVDGAAGEGYNYLGLGEVTYTPATGLTLGRYTIEAYAPYGYRVAGISDQVVEFVLKQDSEGSWLPCHQTVTIEITPTWPSFFYSWAWGNDE